MLRIHLPLPHHPHAVERRRMPRRIPVMLDFVAGVLTGLGLLHAALLWTLDLNVLSQVFGLEPLGVAVTEGLLVLAGCHWVCATLVSHHWAPPRA